MDLTLQARTFRTNMLPNGNTFSCLTCHNSSTGGSRNLFGQDVEAFVTPNGSQQFWSSVFNLDSDGDGFTNGEEMGDPEGDGRATPGFRASRPWLATSVPVINKPPTVTLATDQTGLFALRNGSLKLTATALDTDGTVSRVEFFVDGVSQVIDTTSPFELALDLSTLQLGNRTFTAKATDNQSGSTTSTGVTLRIRDPLRMDPPKGMPDGTVELTWPSLVGSRYVIEHSEDLVTWEETVSLVATETVSKLSQPDALARRGRFFRAREVE